MARLPYLDPPGEIADRIRERRGGTLRPLDQVLLHSPAMAEGWNGLLGAVRRRSSLPDDVRELVILRVAALNGAAYEWDAHAPIARAAGLGEHELDYLREPGGPSPLTSEQQVAFDFTTALTRTCRVDDALFASARGAFGEQGVVDLAVAVGAYNMVSRFLTALDVGETLDEEKSA